MTKRTFKKSVSATIATVMLLMVAGCGNSQQPTNTQQSTTEAVAANKTQSVTTAPETTKAPETTTKAEEKTTVSSTESASQVTAIQTTEAAASANNSIDYSKLKKTGKVIYVPGEETVLANFVENVGMRTVANGETIDLSDCMDFSNCSSETILSINERLSNYCHDMNSEVTAKKIFTTYRDNDFLGVEFAFKLDTDAGILYLYAREIK